MPKNLPKRFTDEAAARQHLEGLLWPDGPSCPHCGVVNEASRIAGGRKGLLFCNACRKQFSVTVGTVYERSKVPLHIWLYANHLLCASKKGISSQQLARMLGVTVKTAWFMSHRIRETWVPASGSGPLGGEGKIVEADETEISPSRKSRPRKRSQNKKFVALVERGGRVRSKVITGAEYPIGIEVRDALYRNVDRKTALHTDGAQHYKYTMPNHESVDHDKAFARTTDTGERVHTNSAEGYFSIFKRGLVGTYQHMSSQHLHRYLAEFDFRMNHRVKLGYSDDMRADKALEGIVGKRLTYRRPNETTHA
ncbi:MAG: IS1595 family transposase [Alphaproteobacteria bacterium]|nr:IS1595 family transposase [Alphaproteobacteria bacterium]